MIRACSLYQNKRKGELGRLQNASPQSLLRIVGVKYWYIPKLLKIPTLLLDLKSNFFSLMFRHTTRNIEKGLYLKVQWALLGVSEYGLNLVLRKNYISDGNLC